jgi:hypothetical protein
VPAVATVEKGFAGLVEYRCRHPWPEDTAAVIRPHNDSKVEWLEQAVAEAEGRETEPRRPRCVFYCNFPAYPNILVRDEYLAGFGMIRPRCGVNGVGHTPEQAEQAAWEYYESQAACDHDFRTVAMSDEAKTPLLDGDGTCLKCSLYIHHLVMDERVHRAWNLAAKSHDGRVWRGVGGCHFGHLRKVYEAVCWRSGVPWEEQVRMGAAALLCDVMNFVVRVTLGDIRRECGDGVADLISEATFSPQSPQSRTIRLYYGVGRSPWLGPCNDRDWVVEAAKLDLGLCDDFGDVDPGKAKYIASWARHNLKRFGVEG